ncbi:MAG TPA: carbon-nitrogen hydrolase family protein [Gaiellaceae bacterium]|nr:carbon-nitrogen hydrolase family protein [Gaiellaceae bacterium]
MKDCTVAAASIPVRQADVQANLETHARIVREAAAAGCELVVFPELSVTGHNASPEVTRVAEPHDGPILEVMAAQARESHIVIAYGFCEERRGTHYNTCALVGPDGLVGHQRKVHASYDEGYRFRQAYEWGVFDLGFCRVGIAICHDSDFFETWRILTLLGAELILLPHANRTLPARDGSLAFDGRGHEASAKQILRAQEEQLAERPWPPRMHDVLARDNAVFAVFADQVGFDGHSTHVGGAYVLAPDGSLLTRSEPDLDSALVVAELDPVVLRHARENPMYVLRKRRPEAYEELTRRQ